MNVSEKPKAHRRDASEIVSLIEQCGASGLTVSEFCGQHGLNKGTFHTWKKRYRTFGWKQPRPGFVKLQVKQSMPGLFAEVNGIRLYQTVSASFLKELLP